MNISGHDISRHGRITPIAAILLLLTGMILHAQPNGMRFDHITSEQGLSNDYVLSILQDRFGFMWFGTMDGLNQYDGYHFKFYRHDAGDPGSISDGSVGCMIEDHTGALWVGTHSGGISQFDREHGCFINYIHDPGDSNSIARGRVVSICEDGLGDIWLGIADSKAGLCRFDRLRNSFVRYHHDPANPRSLSSDNVTYTCRDRSGVIWIGTADSGLNRYDPRTGTFINHHQRPQYSFASTRQIDALYAAPDGALWIRSDRWMMVLAPDGNTLTSIVHGDLDLKKLGADDFLNAVYYDSSGRLWLGTRLNGVFVVNQHRAPPQHMMHSSADRNSISSNLIFCFLQDASGNIWIGTDQGIDKLSSTNWNFEYYRHDPRDSGSIIPSEVRCIERDSWGRLWMGTTASGVAAMETGMKRTAHYMHDPGNPFSLSENTVNKVFEDSKRRLWIGTNSGLNLYDRSNDRFIRFRHDPADPASLPLSGIWEILEDHQGNLWVGTLGGGLSLFDPRSGRFRHNVHHDDDPGSLSHNKVLCMHEDRRGNLWIGTDDGLNRLDRSSNHFVRYLHDERNPRTLSNNRVWFIHEDRDGVLWIGTSGGGLNRFDPATGQCTAYTEKDGLANNTVCGILEDGHGRLWISTHGGISRFDPATRTFRNYTARDGLSISKFSFKACHRDADGFMYFGGTTGIIRFHPDSIREGGAAPTLVLTSFRVFDAEYPLDTSISVKHTIYLPHDSSFFSIGFAALNFTNASGNRYKYRLEGLDAAWREIDGTDPRAYYTSVPPGIYTFQVTGAENYGPWSTPGASLTIVIEPAFWQTWWFTGLAGVIIASMILAIGYFRIREIRREGELKRRLVEHKLQALRAQMNPHFIFNSLNSILHFVLRHDAVAAHLYLAKFSKLIRMTLEHSKSESIALADEIEALRFYLELESVRFDRKFTYRIEVDDGIDLAKIQVPPMLIQPHVENAIKHGLIHKQSGRYILIDIRKLESWIVCSVVDNGIGRGQSVRMQSGEAAGYPSRGMEITRERLDIFTSLSGNLHGFEVQDLFDEQGNPCGTRVEIRIPEEKP